MKIYGPTKCSNEKCQENGWCLYGGKYWCGRCLEQIMNKMKEKQSKEAMEIFG